MIVNSPVYSLEDVIVSLQCRGSYYISVFRVDHQPGCEWGSRLKCTVIEHPALLMDMGGICIPLVICVATCTSLSWTSSPAELIAFTHSKFRYRLYNEKNEVKFNEFHSFQTYWWQYIFWSVSQYSHSMQRVMIGALERRRGINTACRLH